MSTIRRRSLCIEAPATDDSSPSEGVCSSRVNAVSISEFWSAASCNGRHGVTFSLRIWHLKARRTQSLPSSAKWQRMLWIRVHGCDGGSLAACGVAELFFHSIYAGEGWDGRGMSLTWQWRQNERDGVLNHLRLDCLLNRSEQRRHQSSASLAFVRGIHRSLHVLGVFVWLSWRHVSFKLIWHVLHGKFSIRAYLD